METRPLSKDKRWRLVEIMEKAKIILKEVYLHDTARKQTESS